MQIGLVGVSLLSQPGEAMRFLGRIDPFAVGF